MYTIIFQCSAVLCAARVILGVFKTVDLRQGRLCHVKMIIPDISYDTLGSFNDKTVRTSIHLYTRMVFPAVQTTTIQEVIMTTVRY